MRKICILFVAMVLSASLFAQSPQKMSYQAVIRNASNALVTSTVVGMQISILQGSANGTAVYVETQTPTTNTNGLVSLEIGNGTVVNGIFAIIDWANGPYFIKTETDPAGGTNYTITGTSQLLSVPYALHAKTAESITGTITETDPVYTKSQAAKITANDITKLSNLSGTNTGDQDLSGLATTTSVTTALSTKVDKEAGKGLSANDYTTAEKTKLAAISGTNTGDQDLSGLATTTAVTTALDTKVDKEAGKGLSANDYTTAEKTKLAAISGTNTGDQDLSGLATTTAVTTALDTKVDKEAGKGLSANDYTTAEKTKLAAISGTNTGDQDLSGLATTTAVTTALSTKVDKEAGKGLSANDYTTAEKTKLAAISGTNTGDQDLSGLATTTSVTAALSTKVDKEAGKGLSSNDYTTAEQTKLAAITGTNTGDQDLSGLATTTAVTTALDTKVDKEAGKGLSANDYTTAEKTKLAAISGTNTGDQDLSGLATTTAVTTALDTKVDKEAGKGLSANDYTTAEKTKLAAISGTNTGDQDLSGLATTTAVTTALDTKVDKEAGKGLSANDYTTAEKTKLAAISGTNTGDQDLSGLATTTAVTTALDTKVDKEAGKGLSANDYTTAEKTKLAAISGTNTGDQDLSGLATTTSVTAALSTKVDKEAGKGLSSNDYTTAEQTKLAAITGTNTGDQDLSGLATTTAVTTALDTKVDKEAGKGLSANDYTTAEKTKLAAISGTNTGDQDLSGLATTTAVTTALSTKVDKEAGKGLSTNDFTTAEQTKLAAITGTNTGDQDLSGLATTTSVTTALSTKVDKEAGKGLSSNDYTTAEQTKLAAITGTNTGDQDLSELATIKALGDSSAQIRSKIPDVSGFLKTESDPSIPKGTAPGQMLYWNGTAWVTIAATPNEGATLKMIGGVPQWTGGTPPPPVIGDNYQGGIVIYILQPGDPGYVSGETHGLIASPTSQGFLTWWNGSYIATGATATALGTGSANTALIVSAQGNTGNYAAKVCADYSVTVDGITYDDWYLPSRDELVKYWAASSVVPSFSYSYYWSSSDFDSNNAWWLDCYPMYTEKVDKKWEYAVRAIRSF